MPKTNRPLPIRCPKCNHKGCTLVVKSRTVMTVQCGNCRHSWATDRETLPGDIQAKVDAVLHDDHTS
jgi:transcription elongation factor Elf1